MLTEKEASLKTPKSEETPSPHQTLEEVKDEAAGQPSEEGETCPVCGGGPFKQLERHISRMITKGDEPHSRFKESGRLPGEEIQWFSDGAGDLLVYMLLQAIRTKRPDLIVPEGWEERAGIVHQDFLERYVGRHLEEKSDLAMLGMIWGSLYTANMGIEDGQAAAESLDNRNEGHGQDPPGGPSVQG